MRHLLHKIVTKKTERLRACLLLALLIAAGGLALGGREAMPAPAAPAEAPEPDALNGLTVALDPGHGGYDGGARAQDSGRWEKDVALEIALEVEKALLARGAQVVLTRREDVCLADGDALGSGGVRLFEQPHGGGASAGPGLSAEDRPGYRRRAGGL